MSSGSKARLAALEAALAVYLVEKGVTPIYPVLAVTGHKGFMFLDHHSTTKVPKYETAPV